MTNNNWTAEDYKNFIENESNDYLEIELPLFKQISHNRMALDITDFKGLKESDLELYDVIICGKWKFSSPYRLTERIKGANGYQSRFINLANDFRFKDLDWVEEYMRMSQLRPDIIISSKLKYNIARHLQFLNKTEIFL